MTNLLQQLTDIVIIERQVASQECKQDDTAGPNIRS